VKDHGLRISLNARRAFDINGMLFPKHERSAGYYRKAQDLAYHMAMYIRGEHPPEPSKLYAAGLLSRIYQRVIEHYLSETCPEAFSSSLEHLEQVLPDTDSILREYHIQFPSGDSRSYDAADSLQGMLLTILARRNPALISSLEQFFDDSPLAKNPSYLPLVNRFLDFLSTLPPVASTNMPLPDFLLEPIRRFPDDLTKQLLFIREQWVSFIPELAEDILRAVDVIREETRAFFPPGKGETHEYTYHFLDEEIERYSKDTNWMPRVVMIAKSALVWLDQLSRQYGFPITRLDQIPQREIELLAERGFTALWLIGIWERSAASKEIKRRCGNPEADASAYSLKRYEIAESLGGWPALDALRRRCKELGVRLASDMVPNHTGLDSDWLIHRPDLFLQVDHPPFPSYSYQSEPVCNIENTEVYIEDHYYDRSDAAVTCKRVDARSGDVQYVFHGNDGTSTPWNDTAQLDYLNPDTREIVVQTILHVARNFPIIRFDAAMTLAKRHIQRLWYPKPGQGGDIPGRSFYSMTDQEFHQAIPKEFWREVVDRVAQEAPDTLLLAEAFWMMEGYFVRSLGMHRVYNSAFMNMLKDEENEKYRNTIKNTLQFDPEILKRFVNFMNNPDEETAVAQFGDGDKYFGVTTLLATMPGLPMFGHGQIEGYREKYGMEYTRAYLDEKPDQHLVDQHYRRIFPLLKLRPLFAESSRFRLYDFHTPQGVNEHVYAYTNALGDRRALVLYNNSFEQTAGWFKDSVPFLDKTNGEPVHRTEILGEALGASPKTQYYLIFQDPVEGLTYIRQSTEVHSRGLYAVLKGYETQVFMNFYEVYDAYGLYHELASLLHGKGSPNFEHELSLLRLRPLHSWMHPFIEADQLKLMELMISGKEQTLDTVKQRWLALYRGLVRTWNTQFHAEGTSLPSQLPESVLRHLLEYLDCISRVFARINRKDASNPSLYRFVTDSLAVMPEFPVILMSSVIVAPLAYGVSEGTFASWVKPLMLDTLFDQPLSDAGVPPEDIIRSLLGSEFFSRYSDWTKGLLSGEETSADVLYRLFSDALFREYTGCNWHEGIQWYRKESFQEALVLLALTHLLSSADHTAKEENHVCSVLYSWYIREPQSGYRVDRLLEAVSEDDEDS